MFWRKWFVRLLVFAIVGGCAGGVLLYQRFTNPAAVREQVLATLRTQFAGATVTVDSARLRIMGGISVQEFRLARKDDPDKSEILHVPSAVLYHDKEKILDGEVAFRKVVLERPHFRMQRNRDGSWNWQGVSGQLQSNLPLPVIVIRQGTLILEDRMGSETAKIVELTDVDLRLVNDPLDQVTIEGSANSEVAGKLRVQGQWQRQNPGNHPELQGRANIPGVHRGGPGKTLPARLTGRPQAGGESGPDRERDLPGGKRATPVL